MTVLLAAVVGAAIVVPHCVALDRVAPAVAATIWLSALALRALTAVFIAFFVVFFLGAGELFGLVTHWCWNAVIPLVTTRLGLDGHQIGHAASVAPSFVLVASVVSVGVGIWRATRAVRHFLRRAALGTGPRDSVLIGGSTVLVAAAGLRRPSVVVSAGALTNLDDEELVAGLDHERGHIERSHRFALLVAELCRALARFLPGTRAAVRELRFHLERDADHWAVKRRNDPLALASAICKAADQRLADRPLVATLGGPGTSRRITQLLNHHEGFQDGRHRGARLLAAGMVALTFGLVAILPATAVAGVSQLAMDHGITHCPS